MLAAVMMCLVVGIVDGDTVDVRCGNPGSYEQIRIRINAIDAPESSQAFGQVSKRSASDLCYMQEAKITPNNTKSHDRIVAAVCTPSEEGTCLGVPTVCEEAERPVPIAGRSEECWRWSLVYA